MPGALSTLQDRKLEVAAQNHLALWQQRGAKELRRSVSKIVIVFGSNNLTDKSAKPTRRSIDRRSTN